MSSPAERNRLPIETLRRLLAANDLRVVILAAHPDDETIGSSALLARNPNAQIVYLTDGAPRDRQFWPPDMNCSRDEYAALRRHEAAAALAHAGIGDKQIVWLGGTDQEAIFDARVLAEKFGEVLASQPVDVLITHPYEGGHPDHDCAALVGWLAIENLKDKTADAAPKIAPLLCEMTSYHARDGQCVTGEFLNSDGSSEIIFHLTDPDRERKRRMMDSFISQRLVLENFPVIDEKLRIAPIYDFSQPPHERKLWYECMNWPMTGSRWRELAACCSPKTQEPACR